MESTDSIDIGGVPHQFDRQFRHGSVSQHIVRFQSQDDSGHAKAIMKSKRNVLLTKFTKGINNVKSALGAALANAFAGGHDINDFAAHCKAIFRALQRLHYRYGESVIDKRAWQVIEKAVCDVDKKDICISIFGQHNCGKSTFLNALIGANILPTLHASETSVKVEVQHDSRIHQGLCSQNCYSKTLQCPSLHTEKSVIMGVQQINEYLRNLNKDVRDQKAKPPSVLVLKVYIPLLAERVPDGWTVKLVDNPGFGEAKEHVTQLADASLSTSSAYIYLLLVENIGGTEAKAFFKELSTKDKDAICDGRLTIGINKFDNICSDIDCDYKTMVEDVTKRTVKSIYDATQDKVPDSTVIPLCSNWALIGSKLARHLYSDPGGKETEILTKRALQTIENCTFFDIECGQGETPGDAIKSQFQNPMAIVDTLNYISGAASLKARIEVVGSACVKVWATKLHNQFCFYVEETQKKLAVRMKGMEDDLRKTLGPYEESRRLQSGAKEKKGKILGTIVSGKKKTSTTIRKDFEKCYDLDLEDSKPQDSGKEVAKLLLLGFKDECKAKISEKKLGPQEFEADLHKFLDDSARKLQSFFDSSCGFRHIQEALYKHKVEVVSDIESLRNLAGTLCGISADSLETDRLQSIEEVQKSKPLTIPNLGDIKVQVKIPAVSLLWWEKIIVFFRSLGRRRSNSSNIHEERVISPEEPAASSSDSAFTSEKDSDDDQLTNEDTPQPGENNPDSETTVFNPIYRKWTPELDASLDEVLSLMEEVCDSYFTDIKHKAVKFFYREYCNETSKKLKQFDFDYSERLEKCGKSLDKDAKNMDAMKKEIDNLQTRSAELESLKAKMIHMFIMQFGSH